MTENVILVNTLPPSLTQKMTNRIMSLLEYTALVTTRAVEIENETGPQVNVADENRVESPIVLAKLEIASLKPGDNYHLCIQRKLPSGEKEIWKISEMLIRTC